MPLALLILTLVSLLVGLAVKGETFPVCAHCNCAILPATLDGRVVDVPASLEESTWFTFSEPIVSNQTVVLIFRSVDQTANVEIKLKSINASYQYIVYPAGRLDPTVATNDLGPVYYLCSRWTDYLTLGPSVVSTGPELAIAFIASPQFGVAVSLQLLYRQHQPTTKNLRGLPLPLAPLNRSSVKVKLVNSFIGGGVPPATSTIIVWSIAATAPNCSIEVTFTASTNNTLFSLNDLNPALVGVTHKLPQGKEAIITVWKASAFALVEAMVNVEYRAVDCGLARSKTMQISSWGGVVKPLKSTDTPQGGDPWRTVNFTFPADDAQQVAIWFLSGLEPAYTPLPSWKHSSESYIPQLYMQEFFKLFNNSISPGTLPFVFFLGARMSIGPISFKYAFLPASASPTRVAVANSTKPMALAITPSMITARRIYIQAANGSCSVAVWRPLDWLRLTEMRLLPFGFDSTLNDILDEDDSYTDSYTGVSGEDKFLGSPILTYPTRSFGSIMGIQFHMWMDLASTPRSVLYRMVCPTNLDSSVRPGKWQYVPPPAGTFVLPRPPRHNGKNCRVDVSSVSTDWVLHRDRRVRLLVACLQPPMNAKVLPSHMTTAADDPCNGTLRIDAYAPHDDYSGNGALFAYRVRCSNDAVLEDDGLAPFLPLRTKYVAVDKWKTLKVNEYEYEATPEYTWPRKRETWMLQAKNPNCRVEVFADQMDDLWRLTAVEDFMSTDVIDSPVTELTDVKFKRIRYVSCDHRILLAGLGEAVGQNVCKYRQVCGDGKPGFGCSQNVTVEPSPDGKWQTLEAVSTGSQGQLFSLHYHINLPKAINGSIGKVLELEFTSLISAESWFGTAYVGRYGSSNGVETHGVLINSRFRAIAGKQYLFKDSVDIKVDALARSKRGDQLFKVRYRLVDAKQAIQEIRLGEVLIAAHTAKTLEFKIPQQFSQHRLKEIIQNGQFDPQQPDDNYYHERSGDFPLWFFHHYYTIKPSKASCRVALWFTRMDIGSGFVAGYSKQYNNEQHRLSVISGHPGTQSVPLTCASDLIRGSANRSVCARMDRTYMSAPGVALGVLFKSTDMSEYENDQAEFWGDTFGAEVTFGSGWTATYQEVCDAKKAEEHSNKSPVLVKAIPPRRANDWQKGLPGQPKDDKYRLFHDQRWSIIPAQVGCAVEYMLEAGNSIDPENVLPVLFQVGSNATWPEVNQTFTSSNVTVIQLGTNKANPVTIKYRQVCTSVPTASPTRHHGETGNNRDGQTCAFDWECASGVCSKTLQRCTTAGCLAQCALKNSSQALCVSYAAIGCSCQWLSGASPKPCVPVV